MGSPSCTCGLSDRSCGSSRRCSPSSVASGWFFSTRPSPRSVMQSGASSGPLQGLFSRLNICPVQEKNFREDLTLKPETDCVNVTISMLIIIAEIVQTLKLQMYLRTPNLEINVYKTK